MIILSEWIFISFLFRGLALLEGVSCVPRSSAWRIIKQAMWALNWEENRIRFSLPEASEKRDSFSFFYFFEKCGPALTSGSWNRLYFRRILAAKSTLTCMFSAVYLNQIWAEFYLCLWRTGLVQILCMGPLWWHWAPCMLYKKFRKQSFWTNGMGGRRSASAHSLTRPCSTHL